MYPNDNQPTNPVDYLNQIAPQPQPKLGMLPKKPILLAGIGLVVVIVIISIMALFSSLSGGIKPTERLAARLKTTEDTVASAKYIKSSQLKALNSDLKLYLINTIRDVTPILTSSNIKIDNLGKNVMAAESNEALLATLEDARLNAIYDRTYAREMAYQLDTILTLMTQINNSSDSKDMKSFLVDARKNLELIQKDFADFNEANS